MEQDALRITVEHWQRLERLFQRAIDLSPVDRASFLRSACDGDHALEDELTAMLEAVVGDASAPPAPSPPTTAPRLPGRQINEYELDRQIGQGGMGSVYLAHRVDGHFDQQVALKLVSSHLRSEFFTSRFRTERQILAGLNHPNITRLLDGGVTPDGDPYLVMEYVDGLPLSRYCDEHRLSVRARIELFLQVCAAVEYAHRRLIVHCDLKPGNILVTHDGTPKLLDFGTARLLSTAAAESTTTRFGLLTPRYASPERLRGEPIDTSTDLFSLGVILYEVLAGAWPFGDPNSLLAELERAVGDVTPVRPASLVTEEAAGARGISRAKLAQLLSGDLAAILQKSVNTQAAGRYRSVEHFTQDLRCYLTGQTVSARPQTWTYHWRKSLQRHWVPVTAAAVFVLALAASTVYSARQAQLARQEAEKATTIKEFLRELLATPASPDPEAKVNLTVLEAVDRAQSQLGAFSKQPYVLAELHYTLGTVYLRLNDLEKAERECRAAVALGERIATSQDLAWAREQLAWVLHTEDIKPDEVEHLYAQATAEVRRLGAESAPDLAHLVLGRATQIAWQRHGHSPAVEAQAREVIRLAERYPAAIGRQDMVYDYTYGAIYMLEENRDAEASEFIAKAIAIDDKLPQARAETARMYQVAAELKARRGDWKNAETLYRRGRDKVVDLLGRHALVSLAAEAKWQVARVRAEQRPGVLDDALRRVTAALNEARALTHIGRARLVGMMLNEAELLNEAQRAKDAEQCAREALQAYAGWYADSPYWPQGYGELGLALQQQPGRAVEARAALEESERRLLAEPHGGAPGPVRARVEEALARLR